MRTGKTAQGVGFDFYVYHGSDHCYFRGGSAGAAGRFSSVQRGEREHGPGVPGGLADNSAGSRAGKHTAGGCHNFRGQQTFTTKGDANDVNDAVPVLWKNTVGKLVFGIPLLGGPFSVVSAKGCRWLMTGIAAAFLLLSLGRSFYRDRKENKGAAESDT